MKKLLLIIGASAMLAAPALAGINPAAPGLPTANTGAFSSANNGASSMCVDCHTVQPKAGGSHYVNASATAGATNSGGSGNLGTDGAVAASDDGKYFKLSLWDRVPGGAAASFTGAATYSKYRSGTASVSFNNATAGVRTTTTDAAIANYQAYDIICESCHNIVVNDVGGNNLLAAQPTNDWEGQDTSDLCVGCHGFMYTVDAGNSTAPANANYGGAINENETTSADDDKGNNEQHWIKGTAYNQNHHVMTGDNIDAVRAAAGLLWTDNLVISYSDVPIDNGSTLGTYPQKGSWTITGAANVKPAAGLSCTNCHTPAHGMSGSVGASILRGGTYTAPRATAISRISDANVWKKIDDRTFCNQCHQ